MTLADLRILFKVVTSPSLSVLHPVTKTSKHQTTVKWKSQSPDFHEQFVYSSSMNDLAKQSLYVTVWDREKGRPDEYIGQSVKVTGWSNRT